MKEPEKPKKKKKKKKKPKEDPEQAAVTDNDKVAIESVSNAQLNQDSKQPEMKQDVSPASQEPKVEPKPEPKPEPEPKAEPKSELKEEPKPKLKTEPQQEPMPEPKEEPKEEPKQPEPKPEVSPAAANPKPAVQEKKSRFSNIFSFLKKATPPPPPPPEPEPEPAPEPKTEGIEYIQLYLYSLFIGINMLCEIGYNSYNKCFHPSLA